MGSSVSGHNVPKNDCILCFIILSGAFCSAEFFTITFDPLRSFEIKYNLLNLAVAVESAVGGAFSLVSNSVKSTVVSAVEKKFSSSEFRAGVKASVKDNFDSKGVKVTSAKLTEVAGNKVKTVTAEAKDAINVTKDALDLTVGINASGYTSKNVNEKIDK